MAVAGGVVSGVAIQRYGEFFAGDSFHGGDAGGSWWGRMEGIRKSRMSRATIQNGYQLDFNSNYVFPNYILIGLAFSVEQLAGFSEDIVPTRTNICIHVCTAFLLVM